MTVVLQVAEAAQSLHRGGVVAYPTEAVWGLGCDPFAEAAVLRLLAIKQRPVDKGVILVAGALEQFEGLLDWSLLPTDRCEAVYATWPGPHTWIVPASPAAPRWITGAHAGIAVRVSAHQPVVELCRAYGGALVSTSANRAGQPAAHGFDQLDPAIVDGVDAVLAGDTGGLQRPTDIRDARTGIALRL